MAQGLEIPSDVEQVIICTVILAECHQNEYERAARRRGALEVIRVRSDKEIMAWVDNLPVKGTENEEEREMKNRFYFRVILEHPSDAGVLLIGFEKRDFAPWLGLPSFHFWTLDAVSCAGTDLQLPKGLRIIVANSTLRGTYRDWLRKLARELLPMADLRVTGDTLFLQEWLSTYFRNGRERMDEKETSGARPGKPILVVGADTTKFDEAMLRDPRIRYWGAGDVHERALIPLERRRSSAALRPSGGRRRHFFKGSFGARGIRDKT